MSGEVIRRFLKHKVFGEVYGVEASMPSGEILGSIKVDPTTMCQHALENASLDLDDVASMNAHRNDFEIIELPCRDASHWLHDIGGLHRACVQAASEYAEADARAKELKKALELKEQKLRAMVRDAVDPKPMPLFDKPAA